MRTLLEGGDVVAYADGGHRLLRGGTLVFEDDRVVFVGRRYPGHADRRIDATGTLVMPGLVNIHCHADTEAGGRLVADAGRRDYFHAGFLNYFAAPRGVTPLGARGDRTRGARFALVEMLKSGCTTVVPIGGADEAMIETIGALGMRAYVSPAYKDGSYVLDARGALTYEWDEAAGRQGLERAKTFIGKHDGAHAGRVRGMLFPYQVDTCSPALLRATRQAADALGVGIEIHAGQNLLEFHEILRRHVRTPVEFLEDVGLLGPDAILGHCIISTAHHLAALPAGRDLEILARTGTTVAHCPLVFARRGNALESFHRFRAAGVNVGLGTDTYPRDLVAEMRWASLLCKIVEHDFTLATAGDVLGAATLGGARALRRDDLGRLAPGAKADIVVVDLRKIRIGPYRDPIRALVNCATMDDVTRVFVDGRPVVDGGRVVGVDEEALLVEAQAEAERLWKTVPEWHWEQRTADEMSPPSLPALEQDLGG
ncbi:MAG: amidohydrolase family protein [Candidatus Rokubacteria bacterium]|nr:amidohydrolase family protein [Candidatus Rokubacteria bacterium]MBI3825024.1 amidohydrolase family protein [Candidatus Rokubacteria bacterium]